jgi:predicted RNase H-like nuclease (RuvC/YqgF family)
MFCMSEAEKYEQIGHLAAEVSRLNEHRKHLEEKMRRIQSAYQQAAQQILNMKAEHGKLLASTGPQTFRPFEHELLDNSQLAKVLEERTEIVAELEDKHRRLKDLAPYLF